MNAARGLLLLLCTTVVACSDPADIPVGQWATGQGHTLIIDEDGSFVMRRGTQTVTGSWKVTTPPQFILSPTGSPLAWNACYMNGGGVKVDDGQLTMTMNRQRPDGTLEPRVTRSSVSQGGRVVSEGVHDCVP